VNGAAKFPVARYFIALPVAAVLFMALAIVDEREVFLSALGEPQRPAAPVEETSNPEAERAVAAVRGLAAAVQAAYRDGSSKPLTAVALAPELRAELELEVAPRDGRERVSELALNEFELLSVEPGGDGSWSVTTDETWVASGGGERHRLRFRYRIAENAGTFRVDEMVPILPEIERAANR